MLISIGICIILFFMFKKLDINFIKIFIIILIIGLYENVCLLFLIFIIVFVI